MAMPDGIFLVLFVISPLDLFFELVFSVLGSLPLSNLRLFV
jgi:hypothetical protein